LEWKQRKKRRTTVQGVVEHAVQNSETRYGVRIERVWYNGFGKLAVRKGDIVRVEYVDHNGYANIENIEIAGVPGVPELRTARQELEKELASAGANKDTRITKAVALKCAVSLWANSKRQDVEERTLRSAKVFEDWLEGKNAPVEDSGVGFE